MDPRVTQLAHVLVRYSLDLQPGEAFYLRTSPLAEALNLAVYQEALLAGSQVLVLVDQPGTAELFFRHANDAQLEFVSPLDRLLVEQFDASLFILAPHNTRALTSSDPARQNRFRQAHTRLMETAMARAACGDYKWCGTVFPTQAAAQEAEMSLGEYAEFVYSACLLDTPDPIAAWQREGERQRVLITLLAGRDQVSIKGQDVDLQLSIRGRPFIECNGKNNFPDGEIFTAPVEHSVNGWVRFSYPALHGGREVEDIELWFEDGKVVKELAAKGQAYLSETLNMDSGSRYLGEWGIGTNYGIQRFTKNMLFDEKMGGTIHLAVGAGYPESGSQNHSALHWDMLCGMAESEIIIDGELVYQNGQFVGLD